MRIFVVMRDNHPIEYHYIRPFGLTVHEFNLVPCPACEYPALLTVTCDKCGRTHCLGCMGTDVDDSTLCLACATIIDTPHGKFVRA